MPRVIYERPLPAGDRGARLTVFAMQELAKGYAAEQEVEAAALEAAQGASTRAEMAEAVRSWIERRIRYQLDPPDNEQVCTPRVTLELGYGDCDDQSVLAAAMLHRLGVPWSEIAFVLVATDRGKFAHVASALKFDGAWLPLETIGLATVGREFRFGSWPELYRRKEIHPIQGELERKRAMGACSYCQLEAQGLGDLSPARLEVAAALRYYDRTRSKAALRKVKQVMDKYGVTKGMAGLGFLATALAFAGPILSATGGSAGGQVASGGLLSAAGGLIGGSSGVSADDLEAPNYILSLDCDRETLANLYPQDLIANYKAAMAGASDTKKLRLQNVSKCMEDKIAQAAAQGFSFQPTNEIVFKDSAGPVRGFTLVRINPVSPYSSGRDATSTPTNAAQSDAFAIALEQALQTELAKRHLGDNADAVRNVVLGDPNAGGSTTYAPAQTRSNATVQSNPPAAKSSSSKWAIGATAASVGLTLLSLLKK